MNRILDSFFFYVQMVLSDPKRKLLFRKSNINITIFRLIKEKHDEDELVLENQDYCQLSLTIRNLIKIVEKLKNAPLDRFEDELSMSELIHLEEHCAKKIIS